MSTAAAAPGPPTSAIGCDHCEPDVPASSRARWPGIATSAAAALVALACGLELVVTERPWWTAPVLLVATLVGAVFPARRAVASLRRGSLDINALMVIAVAGALAIRQWEEAAIVVFLFSAAQWLEAQSLDRARRAISRLLDIAPTDVSVRDDSGERRLSIEAVHPGAVMIVRPGERFALDGIVRDGVSDVNQAPITGESMPVEKSPGDEVFAGSINGHGALTVTVTRRRADTTLARIIHLVESAQARKAPVQQHIDRFAAWYTPSVLALAGAVCVVPVLAMGQPFETWLYRALVVLVVACPCALVISTPVSIVSALASAARHGVLIKGGVHLERLASVRVVAFDKTGTVTTGKLRVEDARPEPPGTADEMVALAASVESHSEHPVAAAILDAAARRGLTVEEPRDVKALPGLGVEGRVNGVAVVCGTPRLFAARGWLTPHWTQACADLQSRGLSPVLVARDGSTVGVLGLADSTRDGAAAVIADLRHLGLARIVLLTGDQESAAAATGSMLGIDEVRASLLPQDKVDAVHDLRRAHGVVAMVGDGINDAPALAAADVGVVMGAIGSHAALETADMALMADDLAMVPYAIRLSRATLANIRANVAIALGLKAVFVVMAAAGVATLWMAVLADTGASILVVANALRLRRHA